MLTKSLMLCGVGAAALCAAMWMGQPVGAQDAGKPSGPAASENLEVPMVPGAAFEEYSLRKLLLEYAAASGKRLLVDDVVLAGLKDGKVILPTGAAYSAEDRIREGLHSQRLTLLQVGDSLAILPIAQAIQYCPVIQLSELDQRHKLEFVSCLIPIVGAEASVMRTAVAPLLTREAMVAPIQGANILLIADTASSVRRVANAIEQVLASSYPKKTAAVVKIPEGVDAFDVLRAMEKILKIDDGHLADSNQKIIYGVPSRDAENVAKQIAEIIAGLKS